MLRKSHRTRSIGASAATLLVVALVAGCGSGDSSSPTGAEATGAADATEAKDGAMRTVLVFDQEPLPSPSANNLHAGLEEGKLPGDTVEATVLTDEDCAPDRQGISHCRNEVRLANGQIAVLRHPHEMHQVPCLAPGEKVLLRRA